MAAPVKTADADIENTAIEDGDYVEDDEELDLEVLAEELGLEFDFEDRPSTTRIGRAKKAATPWEKLLEAARQNPGNDLRVFAAIGDNAKSKTSSRAREIRVRLFNVVPLELWDVSHRFYPSDGSWRVYAKFVRNLTQAESNERIAKQQAQAEKLQKARDAKKALESE